MLQAVRRAPPAPTLAKFSRPRLYHVQRRERLFDLLDRGRSHPILWIAGPPGSGKSTLAASYIEARRLPGLWFQADPGDADPATFFHYLRIAATEVANRTAREAAALPALTAEYASDLPAFTRRFLREFFALFPAGSVLVVDNFHEPKGDAAWRFAFAEGLREIPEGVNLIVLSREPPVAEMARLVGEQRITRIEWDALRFTEDEATALTATAQLDAAIGRAIHQASDGWAAGIVLMREHLARAAGDGPETLLPEDKESVFQYFTGEIFGRARPESQRVLMLAALLPSVAAADAELLSGDPDAPRVLDHLYRRHLFTERRRLGTEPVYQFHGLFREFLLTEGKRRLAPEERVAALDRAAGQLVARGDFDAAAQLYLEAKAWPALVGLTLHAGRSMLADGRRNAILRWLDAIPGAVRHAEPRLYLVEAHAVMHDDPTRCKALVERGFAAFTASRDVRRQLLTAATAIECHYLEWADFVPLDRWIDVIAQLLDPGPEYLSTADALRIRGAQLIALLFRQPDNAAIDEVARTVATLLEAGDILTVPVNDRVNAASILFNYINWKTKGVDADALVARVEPWLAEPQLTAMNRAWWQVHRAFNAQIRGDYARSKKIMTDTEALAAAHGFKWMQVEIYHAEVTSLISSEDLAGAIAALEKLRGALSPTRRMDHAYFKYQESGVLTMQGRMRDAATAAQEALAIGRASGLPAIQVPHFLVRTALCHLHLGEFAEARALYAEALTLATAADRRNFAFHARLLDVHRLLGEDAAGAALVPLRELLADCRESGYYGFLRLPASVLSPVLARALAETIETEYVRAIIRRRKLPPPDVASPDWPWPIAVRSFGEFAILREGDALLSKGKAQKKPLELLKALVAHGGRAVDATMLTSLVWPDAEGDDAKTSFDSNLYRLRKLLAIDGSVQLAEGKLSLNPDVVWVDVWAFEAALDRGDATAALALYRGPFLAVDAPLPWTLQARDRLQARLVRAVGLQGEAHERRREWGEARALYERTLEVDNLAEPIYRRLMVCLREAGDSAAALTTYRRCRELLSIVLGRAPSAETEAVRRTL